MSHRRTTDKTGTHERWVCPRCGAITRDAPARSRMGHDQCPSIAYGRSVLICSACGRAEAMQFYDTGAVSGPETWKWPVPGTRYVPAGMYDGLRLGQITVEKITTSGSIVVHYISHSPHYGTTHPTTLTLSMLRKLYRPWELYVSDQEGERA